ncbi:MAG: single-stranded-DNA-specific exonuclease RecJ [Thermaceae bacterium]
MRWSFLPLPPLEAWRKAMDTFGVGPEAALAYLARGVSSPLDLDPPLLLLPLRGLDEAAEVVIEAIQKRKRIRIHGDYDADGLTGTAILLKGLSALGGRVHPFIPHRLEEGYGIHPGRLKEHIEGADLFITVDCGVTNHAELKELSENGVEVLVTDHHTPRGVPPPGLLVHPAFSETREKPTGAGVAFLLLWKVHERLGLPPPLEYADLAAVGTIADVAPLWGWNRALVREGLLRLKDSRHLGLRLLAQAVGYTGQAHEVAFRIAPRLNAAGRLGEAETALKLLLSEEEGEAKALAQKLHALNARRQAVEEEMLTRLLPQAEAMVESGKHALVLLDEKGHPGVMGIVASRLVERFYKPVFIVSRGKGSVRSTPGISAVGALESVKGLLSRYGGHKEAAGFAMDEAHFPAFKERIEAYVAAHPPPQREVVLTGLLLPERLGHADAYLGTLHMELARLEPFGAGNPEPLFLLEGEVEGGRLIGEGRHRAFYIKGVRVVQWRNGELPKGRLRVAGVLTKNTWTGETIELEARAILPESVASPSPEGGGWARPIPVAEALRLAKSNLKVYLPPDALPWGRVQGFELASLEEADLWLGLPERHSAFPSGSNQTPFRPTKEVLVALGPRTKDLLKSPKGDALASYLGHLLVYAYEARIGAVFSAALERYLDLLADASWCSSNGEAPQSAPRGLRSGEHHEAE